MASPPDPAPHLDDPRIEAYGMLLEAHNELHNALQRNLDAEAGVPVGWLSVLIRLARSPGERLRMTVLARDMTMSTSGLTRLIDRMEAGGVVQREACPEDRRGLLAVLTDEGRSVLASTAPCHVADLERLLGGALDDRELDQLTDLLRRVRDHVRTIGPPPG
jgi:MarR family transcriptional regulator, 2-MHQ and catechol-resistance regulon repressor